MNGHRSFRSAWGQLGAGARALATYDVFPALSARVRRMLYSPLGVLSLAVLAGLLCGFFLHSQGFILAGGVLAVVVLGIGWPWVSLRGLRGALSFAQARACEGERVEVCLKLRNGPPWPAWGLAVRDGAASPAAIATAPQRRTALYRWPFVPACRGLYPLATPRLSTGFPFGLWECTQLLAVEAPLIVWPRTFPVGPVPLGEDDQQVEGNVARHKVGSSGDVLGVRPYRRGDSPRRIHWGQSAKHDHLIVCELQSSARPVIQLILDADPRVHAGEGPEGSREWGIRIVASLAKGWLEEGAQVGAVWAGQAVRPASGRTQMHQLLDGLACLPDSPGAALAEVLASAPCRTFRDGLQVIVTTDIALSRFAMPATERQRWVVLRAGAFRGPGGEGPAPTGAPVLPVRPWLWIAAAASVPALLHGGWKEARHGS